ncbi:MAG: peptidase [Bacteroidetes bacterium]|nr:peptidase [Bacteroidota bacterium]
MKKFLLLIPLILIIISGFIIENNDDEESTKQTDPSIINFDDYFISKSLRIDYLLSGDAKEETVSLNKLIQEPFWGGPKKNLIDKFNYGTYRIKVIDSVSNKLIYSYGFCTLFQEWQSTAEAKKLKRSFSQTSIFPYPKKTVRFEIDKRAYADGKFNKIFELFINPKNYFINKEKPKFYKSNKIIYSGDPATNVDIAFIAEGYTKEEMTKFNDDVKRIAGYFFKSSPYNKYKNKFNIYSIESASEESGTDIPGKGIYKNTIINSSFYTFDIDRYLTTFDTKSFRDVAANVPYDQIYILINTTKYGGGGFYNHYTACSSNNVLTPSVCIHEFGHGFAGLADEYYTSDVAYENFYNLKVEPWEPNITTMVNFENKWKNMLDTKTPVPTPRTKKYENKIGIFEGGGYVDKGVYSPYQNCRMKSNQSELCPVCQEAISKMIEFVCDSK